MAAQLRPPPILSHKSTSRQRPRPHPRLRPLPVPLDGEVLIQTNIQHLVSFVLLDAWLLFFSKKVNLRSDLRRKYVCRSAAALVETTFLWRSSSFLFRFLVAQGNVVLLGTTEKYRNIQNSSVIPPENTT